jgi:hypothetical protein
MYLSALLTKALVTAPTNTQHASRRSGHVTTLTNVANVTAYLVALFTSTCPGFVRERLDPVSLHRPRG